MKILNDLRLAVAGRYTMNPANTGRQDGFTLSLHDCKTGRLNVLFAGDPQDVYERAYQYVTNDSVPKEKHEVVRAKASALDDRVKDLSAQVDDLQAHLQAANDLIAKLEPPKKNKPGAA